MRNFFRVSNRNSATRRKHSSNFFKKRTKGCSATIHLHICSCNFSQQTATSSPPFVLKKCCSAIHIPTSAIDCRNAELRNCDWGPSELNFCTFATLSQIRIRWDPKLFAWAEPDPGPRIMYIWCRAGFGSWSEAEMKIIIFPCTS
jgi:hypothetical protein